MSEETAKRNDRNNLLTPAQRLAVQLRDEGLKFKEIGKHMNVSGMRANQIYQQAKGILDDRPHWSDGLSSRAKNCLLMNAGLKSRDELLHLFKSGQILRVRNYGWNTHKEVAEWLGLPIPQKNRACPHCGKDIYTPPPPTSQSRQENPTQK